MRDFWLCFVPMFVAVDALGVLPLYVSLTEGMEENLRRRIVRQSVLTAAVVALGFLSGGSALLRLLGITVADFMVAGGLLLLMLSVIDLVSMKKRTHYPDLESLGAVPLGVPLITGPAVLTTTVLLSNQHGFALTSASVLLNIVLAGVVFHFSAPLLRLLGQAGAKTLSKIASLILASIGVMMIRRGVVQIVLQSLPPPG